jgi:hypothetical protein
LPFVTKLCQFTKQQNQNNKVYNKEGTWMQNTTTEKTKRLKNLDQKLT